MSTGLVASAFCIGIGTACYYISKTQLQTLHKLHSMVTSKLIDIYTQLLHQQSAQKDQPGVATHQLHQSAYVEITGQTWCPNHQLVKTSNNLDAIILETRVIEVTESYVPTSQSNSNESNEPAVVSFTRKLTEETLSKVTRGASVYIDDGSDQKLLVDESCIDRSMMIKVSEKFTPVSESGTNINVNVQMNTNNSSSSAYAHQSKVIGHKHVEYIVPYGRTVFALGTVVLTSDHHFLLSRESKNKDEPFLFRYGTAYDAAVEQEKQAKYTQTISYVSFGLAGVTFLGSCIYKLANMSR